MAELDVLFGSGGGKGLAFLGAVEVLEAAGHRPRRMVGTSAGAIAVILQAAGYTTGELIGRFRPDGADAAFLRQFLAPPDAVALRDLMGRADSETRRIAKNFLDTLIDGMLDTLGQRRPGIAAGIRVAAHASKQEMRQKALELIIAAAGTPRLSPLASFLELGGLYSSDVVLTWLKTRVGAKLPGFTEQTTLSEMFERTHRDATYVVADTTARRPIYLNHRTAPDCPAAQAVRMSLSIPLVWQEVVWPADWGKYQGVALTGHALVDGAAALELPWALLTAPEEPATVAVMGPAPAKAPVVGLVLDDAVPPAGRVPEAPPPAGKLEARVGRLVDTVQRWQDELNRAHEAELCRVPTRGYSALEFDMSAERYEALVNSGRCAMREHLQKRGL